MYFLLIPINSYEFLVIRICSVLSTALHKTNRPKTRSGTVFRKDGSSRGDLLFPGNVLEMSRNVPGNFPEMSRIVSGNSRKFPGNVPEISWKCPGFVPELSQIPSEIVSHTSKNPPPNFLKNSLNSLFIEWGVLKKPRKNFKIIEIYRHIYKQIRNLGISSPMFFLSPYGGGVVLKFIFCLS